MPGPGTFGFEYGYQSVVPECEAAVSGRREARNVEQPAGGSLWADGGLPGLRDERLRCFRLTGFEKCDIREPRGGLGLGLGIGLSWGGRFRNPGTQFPRSGDIAFGVGAGEQIGFVR